MAKAAVVDPARAELDARTRWATLTTPPPAAHDEDGRPVPLTPSERYLGILRGARLIAASSSLADAVAALLRAQGVQAEVDKARVDPEEADGGQVVAVRAGDRVVPLRPGGTVLRVYADNGAIELAGPPMATVQVEADSQGWVSAAGIVEALVPHLR